MIYDAMNKTRTKCIQDDATRAANTRVIFEELKIFYDAMTPRCDLRPSPPNSGEAYPSRGDTFLVARFRSCMIPIACIPPSVAAPVARQFYYHPVYIVDEGSLCCIHQYSPSISEILPGNPDCIIRCCKARCNMT